MTPYFNVPHAAYQKLHKLLLSLFKYPQTNGWNWSELYIKPEIVDK